MLKNNYQKKEKKLHLCRKLQILEQKLYSQNKPDIPDPVGLSQFKN